jgi:Glycosyltransferase Family 4
LRTEPHVAVIDGASFVLPYDHGLVCALAQRGWQVTLFASRTRYNQAFLEALSHVPQVQVRAFDVSRTVAPRWRGAWQYLRLWWEVWRRRAEFDAINLQFSILWPLEWVFTGLLRRQLVLTLHNAVPHGFKSIRHRPTATLLARSRSVVFVSEATRADAVRRYGALPHAAVLPHGLLPPAPDVAPRRYTSAPQPKALVVWGNVTAYKGVELMLELARSQAWRATGCALEVHGRFDPSLTPLRQSLEQAGVKVVDQFLDADALNALFKRPIVFLLPYRQATQSGALYTLVHQGCRFVCSDRGDLGDFMRRHGLDGLLLSELSADAVVLAWSRLLTEPERYTRAFQVAQQRCDWAAALREAEAAYGVRVTESPP